MVIKKPILEKLYECTVAGSTYIKMCKQKVTTLPYSMSTVYRILESICTYGNGEIRESRRYIQMSLMLFATLQPLKLLRLSFVSGHLKAQCKYGIPRTFYFLRLFKVNCFNGVLKSPYCHQPPKLAYWTPLHWKDMAAAFLCQYSTQVNFKYSYLTSFIFHIHKT